MLVFVLEFKSLVAGFGRGKVSLSCLLGSFPNSRLFEATPCPEETDGAAACFRCCGHSSIWSSSSGSSLDDRKFTGCCLKQWLSGFDRYAQWDLSLSCWRLFQCKARPGMTLTKNVVLWIHMNMFCILCLILFEYWYAQFLFLIASMVGQERWISYLSFHRSIYLDAIHHILYIILIPLNL